MIYYTKSGKYKKMKQRKKKPRKLKKHQKGLKINVAMGVKDVLG